MSRIKICFLLLSLLFNLSASVETERYQKDLSTQTWRLWLDQSATWQSDSLFLPPVNIANLPVNLPTCGWQKLKNQGKIISIPTTVEELFWNDNGNSFGASGDYVGVSWFTTDIAIPQKLKGKRIALDFESTRLRTEVFVNGHLAGYNLIDGTPFQVDITDFTEAGKTAFLAVRITDPNGNFAWHDYMPYTWGKYKTPPSHGFGGITGRVHLTATDQIFIEDVFIKNTPNEKKIDVEITLENQTPATVKGELELTVHESNAKGKNIKTVRQSVEIQAGSQTTKISIEAPNAKLWSVEKPQLHVLSVTWKGKDGSLDISNHRFGFRWFEIRDVNGDRQFYLNGKRIVLRSAISWGFWPVNGIFPTDAMAEKQVRAAKTLGLNMLNFHRAIGQTNVLDKADELGLLYYEEVGGYNTYEDDDFCRAWGREKLFRMVRRDRNHPSLIIYNMGNERNLEPLPPHERDIVDAHRLDETRVITYTSTWVPKNLNNGIRPRTPAPIKMFMQPLQSETKIQGWWDEHHAIGPGVYEDVFYRNPKKYKLFTDHTAEIIIYGEEGAIGTAPDLNAIRQSVLKSPNLGWDGAHYLALYNAYDRFLSEKGFRQAFPTMESFTRTLGDVAYYFQGRMIENIRINNNVDGYMVNGWEDEKIENHSGIVDCYRNIKGNKDQIAKYNRPLYIAVKVRDKVIAGSDTTSVDFFLVNENDLKGDFDLRVTVDHNNKSICEKNFKVKATGGNCYGQLLVEDVVLPPLPYGYNKVHAILEREGKVITKGEDDIFCVDLSAKCENECEEKNFLNGMALDSTETIINNLKMMNVSIPSFSDNKSGKQPAGKYLLVGKTQLPEHGLEKSEPILNWVVEGNTLVILADADKWLDYLASKEIVDSRGRVNLGTVWFGGNYFVKEHPIFKDLPINCAFNWEYQVFANYNRDRFGLRVQNGETIAGAVSDHKLEAFSAIGIIPLGKGKIIYSTLDLLGALNDESKASSVAKKFLLNVVKYAAVK